MRDWPAGHVEAAEHGKHGFLGSELTVKETVPVAYDDLPEVPERRVVDFP